MSACPSILPAEHIRSFERDFLHFMAEQHNPILEEIKKTQDFIDDLELKILKAIKEFKEHHTY